MLLPNFLVVGAEKAGTSTLAAMLAEHPEVFICNPKEPRFFSQNWNKGLQWYASLFTGAVNYQAVGEASPAYTWAPESRDVPRRIHQCLGNIRYLYIVRNPIERMISHYRHALLYRWIPDHTAFETALKLRPGLKNCSRYFYQIEQYLPYTSRQQWHVVVLEELMKDYQSNADEIFRFLGIGEITLTHLQIRNISNEKGQPPMLFERFRPLPEFLPHSALELVRKLSGKLGKKIPRPEIKEYLRNSLIKELKPDIEKLSDFCGKDFPTIWGI